MNIKEKDITILVSGRIEKETPLVLQQVRKLFPQSKIILSAWVNSDVSSLDYDLLIECEDPGAKIFNIPISYDITYNDGFTPKYNNVNRIIKTIQNGLKNVETKYCLRLRTDLVLKSKNFLNYWDKFPLRDDKFKLFKHRIINNSTYAQFAHVMKDGVQLLPFHMSDWIHFGLTSDLKLLWSCLFQDLYASSEYWKDKTRRNYDPYRDAGWQYPPETYVLFSLVKKNFPNIKFEDSDDYNSENMSFSNKIIVNNFIMIDDCDFEYTLKKYPSLKNWNSELYNGFITYREWQNLYKVYCDKTYNFLDIDFKRMPYLLKHYLNPMYLLKYPHRYFRSVFDFVYVFNSHKLRKRFYIGESKCVK